jgi:hypothetical protein
MSLATNGPITVASLAQNKQILSEIQTSPEYMNIIKYPDGMTHEAMLWSLMNDSQFNNDIYGSSVYPEDSNFPFFEFKNIRGLSSTQTVVAKYGSYKQLGQYKEFKICTIDDGNFEGITNIKINMTTNKPIFKPVGMVEPIEFVLKINGNLICSRTMVFDFSPSSFISYDFISFPNVIINHPKRRREMKIELYARQKFISSGFMFFINYDHILFTSSSKAKIANGCDRYVFETSTGVLCMGINDMVAVRYFTQLYDTVPNEFKKLYILDESAVGHSESTDEYNEDDDIVITI